MPTPLGSHSPRLARVRALRDGRARREQGRFAFEGPTLLAEARAAGLPIQELYASEAAAERHAGLLAQLEAAGTAVLVVADRALARLSELETPPGLLAVAAPPAASPAAILARPGPVLLLAGVADPGNAGTLVRSAEAFGAAGVLFGRGGADPWSSKVVRAAMGSLFRLPVATVDPDAFEAAAAAGGRPIVAAVLDGEPLGARPLPGDAIVAIGSERHGVGGFLRRVDRTVRIEHRGPAESLNAAVAGSILLYLVSRSEGASAPRNGP